eukprot:3206724-Pleurochrysis_carterae.AAC.4
MRHVPADESTPSMARFAINACHGLDMAIYDCQVYDVNSQARAPPRQQNWTFAAYNLIATLFAADGGRKNSLENRSLIYSASEMISPNLGSSLAYRGAEPCICRTGLAL